MTRADLRAALDNANVRALDKEPTFTHVIYRMLRVLLEVARLAQQLHVRIGALSTKGYREYVIQMEIISQWFGAARTLPALQREQFLNKRGGETAAVGNFSRPSITLVDAPRIRPIFPILGASNFHLFGMVCLPLPKSCSLFLRVVGNSLARLFQYLIAMGGEVFRFRCLASFYAFSDSFSIRSKTFTMFGFPFSALGVGLFTIVFLPLRGTRYGTRSTSAAWIPVSPSAIFARFHRGILI